MKPPGFHPMFASIREGGGRGKGGRCWAGANDGMAIIMKFYLAKREVHQTFKLGFTPTIVCKHCCSLKQKTNEQIIFLGHQRGRVKVFLQGIGEGH